MSEEVTLEEFADSSDTGDSQERQETPIGEIPADWGVEWLNDIAEINPDGFSEDDWPSETFEYISLSEASDGEIEYSQTTPLEDAPSRAQRTVQQGDVLVGTVRPKQRSHGFVSEEHDGKICSSGFGVLRHGTRLNSRYLLQEILSNRFFSQMEAYVAGSGYPAVKISDLKKHRVTIPPLPEQRKIATVLYAVDRAIEKTEEIKQQVERVRNGVRQDVFSRGIRESGKERTDDELKETYLGTVPEDWQLRRVDEVCSHVVDCPHSTPNYSEQGTPVVRTSEIEDGRYYPAESPRVDKEGYQKRISRLEPKPGDVVFTREAPIGEAFKIPDGMKLCLGQRLMQLRPKEGVLDADFLVELLYSDMMQSWFERSARGSTSTHVNVGDIEKMEIPVPPIEEQHRIVDVLGGFREQLDSERNLLSRHKRLKRGLMQDLLSGTVRTTDTNIEVPDEIAQYG